MTTLIPVNTEEMVFVEQRVWQKNDSTKPMTFVTVADAKKFERFEFIADKACNVLFTAGQNVFPTFMLSNYNGRPSLQLAQLQLKK